MSDAQVGADATSFILPPAVAGRVWEYLSAIRKAPPSEKLDTWTRTAQLIAGLTGQEFPTREAADRMWATAETDEVLSAYDTTFCKPSWLKVLAIRFFPKSGTSSLYCAITVNHGLASAGELSEQHLIFGANRARFRLVNGFTAVLTSGALSRRQLRRAALGNHPWRSPSP